MIVKIQEELRSIFLKQNNITENIIFLEEMGESEFNTPPWISILSEQAAIEPMYQHTINHIKKDDKTYRIEQKFNIIQPMMIRMVFEDKYEMDNVIDQFLVDIPNEVLVEGNTVKLFPSEVDRVFAKGQLDINMGFIKLTAEYFIVKLHEINKIQNININVNNSHKAE